MKAPIAELRVGLDFGNGIQSVGRMAIRDRVIYFEFSASFIQKGIQIRN
jgi:serine/threonine-protein kinase HipA